MLGILVRTLLLCLFRVLSFAHGFFSLPMSRRLFCIVFFLCAIVVVFGCAHILPRSRSSQITIRISHFVFSLFTLHQLKTPNGNVSSIQPLHQLYTHIHSQHVFSFWSMLLLLASSNAINIIWKYRLLDIFCLYPSIARNIISVAAVIFATEHQQQ